MFWPILGYVKAPPRISDVPGRSESSSQDSSGRDSTGPGGAPGHCPGAVDGGSDGTGSGAHRSSLSPGGPAGRPSPSENPKRVGEGKSVDLRWPRIIKKKKERQPLT